MFTLRSRQSSAPGINIEVLPRLRAATRALAPATIRSTFAPATLSAFAPATVVRALAPATALRALRAFALAAGLVVGLNVALPLSDVSRQCPPRGEGLDYCVIQHSWIPGVYEIVGCMLAAHLLVSVLFGAGPALRRHREDRARRRRAPSEAARRDGTLLAASWGRDPAPASPTPSAPQPRKPTPEPAPARDSEADEAERLQRAVAARELDVRYQPIADLGSLLEARRRGDHDFAPHVRGVEALVRWSTPEGDPISAADFLPLARRVGLLEDIERYVLAAVCRQERFWRGRGLDLTLTVNCSREHLRKPHAVKQLTELVRAAEADPSRIVIDLPEAAVAQDGAEIAAVMRELAGHGFHLALDDFGTAGCSLERLWQAQTGSLKVDRSLVSQLPGDDRASALATASIGLANAFGMTAVAAGIETDEQLEFLVAGGCALGQGYLISKPLTGAQIGQHCAPTPTPAGVALATA